MAGLESWDSKKNLCALSTGKSRIWMAWTGVWLEVFGRRCIASLCVALLPGPQSRSPRAYPRATAAPPPALGCGAARLSRFATECPEWLTEPLEMTPPGWKSGEMWHNKLHPQHET